MSGRQARYAGRGIAFVVKNGWWRYRTGFLRAGWSYDYACRVRRLSRRVHRARRKAERALALTCVATGGAHTPAPTRAVCEACGISKLRVVRGGGQL